MSDVVCCICADNMKNKITFNITGCLTCCRPGLPLQAVFTLSCLNLNFFKLLTSIFKISFMGF